MSEAARRSVMSDVPQIFSLPWPQKMQVLWHAAIRNPNNLNIEKPHVSALIYLKHIQKFPNNFILCTDIFSKTLSTASFPLFLDELHSTNICHFKFDYV